MNTKEFKNGVISATVGSLWWGVLGTYFFQFITFVGTLEVVVHRCIWTSFILFITTLLFKKWHLVKKNIINKKNFFILFITSILIFGNWTAWIYAVATNRIIDASYGYFIFPILTVFFDYLFLKEKLNKKRVFSIIIVIGSSIYLAFNLSSFPWIGILVAILWATYNLLRKSIKVDTDIGLFIESLFILPIAIVVFYFIFQKGLNDFSLVNPTIMFFLFLAGPMTVIPLFLFIKGVEKCGLSASGMIFFITPTSQFLLGYFYYNEPFSIDKFISFILIWFAVLIYLRDLYENN
ncbi:EamA family transporter RarD [Candidatus Pelagibacter sp.]|nr:EamA family transporter RarD [Candidatus Pelagibacter sp.]